MGEWNYSPYILDLDFSWRWAINLQVQAGSVLGQGTRRQVPGTRHQVPGTRHQVPGTKHQVPGTRHQVLGIRHPLPRRLGGPQRRCKGCGEIKSLPQPGGSHRFIVLTGRILVTVTKVLLLQSHNSVLPIIPHLLPAFRRWCPMTENRKLTFPSTILVNNQLDPLFSMYLFISLHYMFRKTQCSSSGESNCVSTSSGMCQSGRCGGENKLSPLPVV